MISNRTLAHVAEAAGTAGQVAGAYCFLLIPGLTVPSPENHLFFTWVILLVLAIVWWRHHPWRSFLVPIVSVPAVMLALDIGTRFLGWAP